MYGWVYENVAGNILRGVTLETPHLSCDNFQDSEGCAMPGLCSTNPGPARGLSASAHLSRRAGLLGLHQLPGHRGRKVVSWLVSLNNDDLVAMRNHFRILSNSDGGLEVVT